MGEVYRARDPRLDREVAIKVLPEAFAADPDRLMRFEREAKSLATLNHPHIAQIHGLEEVPASEAGRPMRALVMEFVDGEDLADRIRRGPLPLDETLPIARQIADALEAAHAKGIIHRDLKPANIKIGPSAGSDQPLVKVLDFGLAKALDSEAVSVALHAAISSPTITSPMFTARGVILGTSAYMSPEQARGKAVDQRADIWAFGCVLFEMVTGRRAFPGDDVTDVLAKVIEREPDWTLLPGDMPRALRVLIQRCLRKDASKRLHHIGDARVDLDEIGSGDSTLEAAAVAPRRLSRVAIALGSLALLAAGGILGAAYTRFNTAPAPPLPRLRLEVPLTSVGGGGGPTLAISPDGRWLAYRANDTVRGSVIRVRHLAEGRELTLGERADTNQLTWSPTSSALLLSSAGSLRRVEVPGLSGRDIPVKSAIQSASWIDDQNVVIGSGGRPYRIRLDDGTSQPLPASDGESRARLSMLPDGQRYFFLKAAGEEWDLCVGTVASSDSSCLTRVAGYSYGGGDLILLAKRDERLLAQRIEMASATLVGEAMELSPSVAAVPANGWILAASVSRDGLVAFRPSGTTGQSELVWFDRRGQRLEPAVVPGPGIGLDLSRDRRTGVTSRGDAEAPGVVVLDLTRKLRVRLTTSPASDPVISPDGRRVAYVIDRRHVHVQNTLGGESRVAWSGPQSGPASLEHWSHDGRYLVVGVNSVEREVFRVDVDGQEPPLLLASKLALIDEMRLSPDGKWLSFNSAESGRDEVYVSPVPPTGERIQLSTAGGVSARWRDDGGEVYYLATDGTLMAVTIGVRDGRLDLAAPVSLLKTGIAPTYNTDHYAVGTDGRSFLLRLPVALETPKVTLLVNWFSFRRDSAKP